MSAIEELNLLKEKLGKVEESSHSGDGRGFQRASDEVMVCSLEGLVAVSSIFRFFLVFMVVLLVAVLP